MSVMSSPPAPGPCFCQKVNKVDNPACPKGRERGRNTRNKPLRNVRKRPVSKGGATLVALLRCYFWEWKPPFGTCGEREREPWWEENTAHLNEP